jgi:hypothetical protein
MPAGWKLKCPNCGHNCKKNGPGKLSETYLRYFRKLRIERTTAEATNKKENARSVPENERTQYNFLTTDSEVFVQIEEENPSLLLIIL